MSLQSFRDWLIRDEILWANIFLSALFLIFGGIWGLRVPDALLPTICLVLPLFFLAVPLILSLISEWNKTIEEDSQ